MTNYIIIWSREDKDGFDFINAENMDAAIDQWLDQSNNKRDLIKMIIVKTSDTYKVPL